MVKPWLEAGHECMIVDIQHEPGTHKFQAYPTTTTGHSVLWKIGADIRTWIPPYQKYDIVFAFPPCTNLSVSGARWFKDKGLRGLIDGLDLVERCRVICGAIGAPYMIENPVSTLSTYWRKPDYTFDPCDYGDPWTKKTCLWTGNGFVMPPKNRVEPTNQGKIHKMPPSEDRGDLRSETPMGFARAVFEANKNGER